MKICLINPPILGNRMEGYEWSNNSYTIQHLGIGYIAGTLEANLYNTDLIECPGENITVEELCVRLIREQYDIIGISTYFYNFINVLRIIKKIKLKLPQTFLFLGGYLPTLCPEQVLEKAKEIDCCVIGEGELTCLELVQAIEEGRDWQQISGIAYLKEKIVIKTPVREQIKELDSLPFPKRVIINQRFVPLSTSRGCYGMCNFCGVREFYEACHINLMRFRSPENVIAEIEYIDRHYNPGLFLFSDETFFSGSPKRREWLEEFYNILKKKNLKIKFHALARANDVIRQQDVICRMREVGLVNVFIGVESFVQRQLDFYKKRTKVEENVEAIRILIENNFRISMGLMLLDPFTTIDEMLENIKWLRDTRCYEFVDEKQEIFSIDGPVIAIPGTDLYKYLEENNLLVSNDIKYEFQDKQIITFNNIIEEWKKYVKPISQRFYLIKKAEKYGRDDIAGELRNQKNKIMGLDIDFMEELCRGIKNSSITDDNYSQLLERWVSKVQPICSIFNEYKEVLSVYQ